MSKPKVGDTSRGYIVYYDTATRRPHRYFKDADEAIAWATAHPEKRPEVCEQVTTTIHVEGW